MDQVLQVAERLRALINEGMNKKAERYFHFLMGIIALEKNDFPEALELLDRACALLRPQLHEGSYLACNEHAVFYNALASACYQAKDLKRAREEYLKIQMLTSGRLYYGDIYAKSFYMLGMICEEESDRAQAIEQYKTFLDVWKAADPGLSIVADARERLAGLRGP
jgi:tetratricopeptide (TPR) repeat protein